MLEKIRYQNVSNRVYKTTQMLAYVCTRQPHLAHSSSPLVQVEEEAVGSLDTVKNPPVLRAHRRRSSVLLAEAYAPGVRGKDGRTRGAARHRLYRLAAGTLLGPSYTRELLSSTHADLPQGKKAAAQRVLDESRFNQDSLRCIYRANAQPLCNSPQRRRAARARAFRWPTRRLSPLVSRS